MNKIVDPENVYWTQTHYIYDKYNPKRVAMFANLTDIGNHTFEGDDRYVIPDYIKVEEDALNEDLVHNIADY